MRFKQDCFHGEYVVSMKSGLEGRNNTLIVAGAAMAASWSQ